jgi:hypothetical protein
MISRKRRGSVRRRVVTVVVVAAMTLTVAACGGGEATSDDGRANTDASATTEPAPIPQDWERVLITLNVEVTDAGFEPASISIPAGAGIQLLMRNHGTTEHHFRVVGATPARLLWVARPDTGIEDGVTEEDHEKHHLIGYVDWRGTADSGIKIAADEIHGWSRPTEMEIMRFIISEPGTYQFEDVLFPELSGELTVFEQP